MTQTLLHLRHYCDIITFIQSNWYLLFIIYILLFFFPVRKAILIIISSNRKYLDIALSQASALGLDDSAHHRGEWRERLLLKCLGMLQVLILKNLGNNTKFFLL